MLGTSIALYIIVKRLNYNGGVMIGLDRIMKIPGVIAAGQFDEEGKIIRKTGDIPDDVREKIAKMNSEQTKTLKAKVQTLDQLTDLEWMPLVGWMMWGGRYALCVVDYNCIIIEVKRADFNQLIVDLYGAEATGGNPPLSGL
jgi:roadblock/LC7 domain-containing protein